MKKGGSSPPLPQLKHVSFFFCNFPFLLLSLSQNIWFSVFCHRVKICLRAWGQNSCCSAITQSSPIIASEGRDVADLTAVALNCCDVALSQWTVVALKWCDIALWQLLVTIDLSFESHLWWRNRRGMFKIGKLRLDKLSTQNWKFDNWRQNSPNYQYYSTQKTYKTQTTGSIQTFMLILDKQIHGIQVNC